MNYDYLNDNIKEIYKTILDKFREKTNSTILINGYTSSCKTLISEYIFNNLNIIPVFYNIFNDKDIYKEIYNFNNNNFNNILNGYNKKIIKGLIIDNLDFVSLNIKKKYLKHIIIDNIVHNKIPIIMITKNESNKLLDEILKEKVKFDRFKIEYNNEQVKNFCYKILDLDTILIDFICYKTNFNLKIILNIYYLYQLTRKNIRNDLLYLEYIISIYFFKTDKNNIFESLLNILNTNDMDKIKYFYDKDKVILPLILHENYIVFLQNENIPFKNKMECLNKISKIISFGDSIETFIYSDQNWVLHNSHCFITCVLTTFILNQYLKNKNDIDLSTLSYSTELNKTSLMNINKKNITNIIQLTNLTLQDIFYLNFLLNNLIHNSIESIIDILHEFTNLNKNDFIKLIDMILKIDKTYQFSNISIIEKKKIIYLLNELK